MSNYERRDFLRTSAAITGLGIPTSRFTLAPSSEQTTPPDDTVNMTSDGLDLSPKEYSNLLSRLAGEGQITPDNYSRGGAVEELESACAKLLGKEAAVFMPTGTLANHLAVRALAGADHRVVVQHESHFYNDSGDCAQSLSQLNLTPLGKDKATFTLDELQETIARTASGRVSTRVGTISIESPVRRKSGEVFSPDELKRVTAFARQNGIRLHLDGARLLIASAYTGIAPADYAATFDTVYISLYKGLNAASGAMLAGPRALLENMYHVRRMFGGGMPEVWPYAVVARHYLDGFTERFRKAVQVSEAFIRELEIRGQLRARRISPGTNIFRLPIEGVDAQVVTRALAARRIAVIPPRAEQKELLLIVNESWNRRSASELASYFLQAFGRA